MVVPNGGGRKPLQPDHRKMKEKDQKILKVDKICPNVKGGKYGFRKGHNCIMGGKNILRFYSEGSSSSSL